MCLSEDLDNDSNRRDRFTDRRLFNTALVGGVVVDTSPNGAATYSFSDRDKPTNSIFTATPSFRTISS